MLAVVCNFEGSGEEVKGISYARAGGVVVTSA